MRIAALVLDDTTGPTRFAGLDLLTRAALTLKHADIDCVHVASNPSTFETLPTADRLVVLPVQTIVEPAALRALANAECDAGEALVVVDDRTELASTAILMLSREAIEFVRSAKHLHDAVRRLAREGRVRRTTVAPRFCASLDTWGDMSKAEHDYLLATLIDDGQGFLSTGIRRASTRLTRHFLRMPVTPTQIRIAGFAMSLLACLAFAIGTSVSLLAGILTCWASVVIECSAGDMTRATLTAVGPNVNLRPLVVDFRRAIDWPGAGRRAARSSAD